MKVLVSQERSLIVTGYRGYIGSSLVMSLGFLEWKEFYLEDLNGSFTIVHLASKANLYQEECSTYIENLILDCEVCRFIVRTNSRIIYFSGNNVYPNMINAGIEYGAPGIDYYSKSKFVTEQLLRQMPNTYFVILRVADVFGKGQRHGSFFKAIENSLVCTRKLYKYGQGRKLRNYIYIEELISIVKFFTELSHFKGETYNIGYEDVMSVSEILEFVSVNYNIELINKNGNDQDKFDIRTMKISKIEGYKYLFNMQSSLHDYVRKVKNEL